MQNLLKDLTELLSKDERIFSEGKLLKNKVIELALKMDADLIKHLLKSEPIKKHFFTEIEAILVFDKIKFQKFVSNKEFLPDSYTAFKNKIGLVNETGDYLSESKEVVIAWPYKDCVLEGGQTKEDQKRDEIFWNETLAPDEIDRLLAPKVFTNWKRCDKDGEHIVTEIISNNNLVIKGNNLLCVSSLLRTFSGKIKLVCIDPPYNKGKDDFNYNDTFNHSTWLSFMKTRLEIAKALLHKNGTIFVFCDDDEHAYLRVLMDNIFGRANFITTVIWRNSDNSNNDAKQFSQDHNYILVYSKNENWISIKLERTEDQSKHYRNPDNDPRGPWFDGNPVNSPSPRKHLMYRIKGPNGLIDPPANGWRWDEKTLYAKIDSGEIRFTEDGKWIKRRTYLNEQKDLPPSTLWEISEDVYWFNLKETGHTRQAKYELKKIFPDFQTSNLFKTPKPERVIKKIIQISTHPGDIVLDFFGGSGTTAAVAHKMSRHYMICEQMDYISTFTIPRLMSVIKGEQGGISKEVRWQGGGSFIYCELMQYNEAYIDRIQKVNLPKDLLTIWNEMQGKAFISYKVKLETINENISDFEKLSLDEQKRFLIEILDKNQLYINYSEIDDKEYSVSEPDKKLNRKFYGAP